MGGLGSTRWAGQERKLCVNEAMNLFTVSTLREPLRRLELISRILPTAAPTVAFRCLSAEKESVGTIQLSSPDLSQEAWPPNAATLQGAKLKIAVDDGTGAPPWLELHLLARRQPRGGRVWLFLCPDCERACRTLYAARSDAVWGCRRCQSLSYGVQRMSELSRMQKNAEETRLRLKRALEDAGNGHRTRRTTAWHARVSSLRKRCADSEAALIEKRTARSLCWLSKHGGRSPVNSTDDC